MGLGKIRLGEMGLGEMGQNRFAYSLSVLGDLPMNLVSCVAAVCLHNSKGLI